MFSAGRKKRRGINLKGNMLSIFLIISLIVCTVAVGAVGTASPAPVIRVEPPTITGEVNQTFTVDITVADISEDESLYGWEFCIRFNDPIMDSWAGDGETKSFVTTEKPVLYESEEVYVNRTFMPRVPEETDTWTGDGTQTTFYTTRKPIRTNSEKVYVDETEMARVKDYTVDCTTGTINFRTAPGAGAEIKATYDYTYYTVGYPTGTITFITAPGLGAEIEAIYLSKPPILQVASVMEGPFLSDIDDTSWGMVPPEIDNYRGWVAASDGLSTYPPQGATGSGVLCNITFQVIAVGKTLLQFYKTDLWTYDVTGNPPPIDHTTVNGTFTNVHDVGVTSVTALPTGVNLSDPVFINVTVANEGDFPETFNITTYWKIGDVSDVIETKTNISLESGAAITPTFTWDTTGVPTGTYTILANATVLKSIHNPQGIDNNLTDNTFIDGEVEVTSPTAPVATFTSSPVTLLLDEVVTFNASASYDRDGGNIVSYEWNFGDRTPAVIETDPVTNHTYTELGEHPVVLKVTDDEGEKSFSQPQLIKVMGYPVATFTYSPKSPLKNWPVTFNASLSDPKGGNITHYTWNFDDGNVTTLTAPIIAHTYMAAGVYTVNLTVTDSEELTGSTTRDVNVSIKHDVAVVSVSTEEQSVWTGQRVQITIVVGNEGTETETFNVTTYYDNHIIETQLVTDLTTGASQTFDVYWPTADVPAGNYTLTAEAILVEDENLTNNKNATQISVSVLDVAITNFTASPTMVLAGDKLNVSVTVRNEGTALCNPKVKIYFANATHSNMEIMKIEMGELASGTNKTKLQRWDIKKADLTNADIYVDSVKDSVTVRISPGTYTLSAEVVLPYTPYELDLADNVFPRSNIPHINVTVGASLISIAANPETITVGSSITINGSITPARSNVSVTIQYQLSGEEAWNTLETVTTDENSTYFYNWTPETAGTYQVKASWLGDNDTLHSESEILIITVNPASPNVFLYAVAAVVIIVMVATAIYFLRVRKSKPT